MAGAAYSGGQYGQGEEQVFFTDTQLATLIELFREEPLLWNNQHPENANPVSQAAALERISERMGGIPAECLKRKLRILRNEYGRQLRLQRRVPQPRKSNKVWRFFNHLDFLRDTIIPRTQGKGDACTVKTEPDYEEDDSVVDDTGCNDDQSWLMDQLSQDNNASGDLATPHVLPWDNAALHHNQQPTADIKSIVPASHDAPPSSSRKRRHAQEDDDEDEASGRNIVMLTAANKMLQHCVDMLSTSSASGAAAAPSDASWDFVQMLYKELKAIPDARRREMTQLRLHSTLLQCKYELGTNAGIPGESSTNGLQ